MIAVMVLAASTHVLTLADAVSAAQANQPTLRQARANTEAAWAKADESRAPLLPQLNGTAQYQRTTANPIPHPGFGSSSGTLPPSSFNTLNYFSFGLTLSQYIWDFGWTTDRWRSSRATAEAQAQTENATLLQAVLNVRTAYFISRANKALVGVAMENLADQNKHLVQIEGFVRVGTRSQIDLAQARTNYANAKVQFITAQNNYTTAKAQLNQTMGVEATTDYEVEDQEFLPVAQEDQPLDDLVTEAVRTRPELLGLEQQVRAQQLLVSAYKGGYGPAFSASTGISSGGTDITSLGWNWNVSVNASWSLFNGLLTYAQVKEAKANLVAIEAQRDTIRQQVRLDVDQARLAVRAYKEAIVAANEALMSAREQLHLAEARYQTGLGSIIELSDAQVAYTTAAAQQVQADYNLATARAQLLKALGRK